MVPIPLAIIIGFAAFTFGFMMQALLLSSKIVNLENEIFNLKKKNEQLKNLLEFLRAHKKTRKT